MYEYSSSYDDHITSGVLQYRTCDVERHEYMYSELEWSSLLPSAHLFTLSTLSNLPYLTLPYLTLYMYTLSPPE